MANDLRITFVSTYRVQCGIATYTENLLHALNKIDGVCCDVLARADTAADMESADPARYCWSAGSNDLIDAVRNCTLQSDVVHFQHEFGIFDRSNFFFSAIAAAKSNGCKVVVTLHTIHSFGAHFDAMFYTRLCTEVDAVVVHTEEGYVSVVAAASVDKTIDVSKIVYMPHGSPVIQDVGNREAGLEYLKLPTSYLDRTIGGAIGFIGEGKNLDCTLQKFLNGIMQGLIDYKKNVFIVAGDIPTEKSRYHLYLLDLIAKSGLDCFVLRRKFIARERLADVFALLDYGILNTKAETLSASGQAQEYIGHGVPLAVRVAPIYMDAIRAGALSFRIDSKANGDTEAVNTIAAFANSPGLRRKVKRSFARYAAATSWAVVASAYKNYYERLTGS